MSGATPLRKASKRARGGWIVVGFVTWLALLAWLVPHVGEKTNEAGFLATVWLLLSVWGVGAAAWGVLRWALRPARPAAAVGRRRRESEREDLVEVCVSEPLASPSLDQIKAALPDYCKTLLTHERRSTDTGGGASTDSAQWNWN
jgi:hypothetical protein